MRYENFSMMIFIVSFWYLEIHKLREAVRQTMSVTEHQLLNTLFFIFLFSFRKTHLCFFADSSTQKSTLMKNVFTDLPLYLLDLCEYVSTQVWIKSLISEEHRSFSLETYPDNLGSMENRIAALWIIKSRKSNFVSVVHLTETQLLRTPWKPVACIYYTI